MIQNEITKTIIGCAINVHKELGPGYRMDLLVENKIVVEIKTVESFTDVHSAQLLTYLKLGNYFMGLLINFHVVLLKDGIKRIINSRYSA